MLVKKHNDTFTYETTPEVSGGKWLFLSRSLSHTFKRFIKTADSEWSK